MLLGETVVLHKQGWVLLSPYLLAMDSHTTVLQTDSIFHLKDPCCANVVISLESPSSSLKRAKLALLRSKVLILLIALLAPRRILVSLHLNTCLHSGKYVRLPGAQLFLAF